MALDRTIVTAVALELLDEVGLEGLTLRQLAARLKVKAPAIYWHFKNKQDLIDEMASSVFRNGIQQIRPTSGMKWDRWAIAYGTGLRRILLLHRDGAKMISGTRLTDNSLYEPMEMALRKFVDAGFSTYFAVVALSTIYSYVIGFVIEEQAVHRFHGERIEIYEPQQRALRIGTGKLPLTLKAGDYLFSNFDRRFKDGLKLVVKGIAIRRGSEAGT